MGSEVDWPAHIFRALKDASVQQASYVPDATHARLIEMLLADTDVHTTVLTAVRRRRRARRRCVIGGQAGGATAMAFDADQCIAVLISQRQIARKQWIAK